LILNGANPMSISPVVVQGTLKSDGTLELDHQVNLPAGRVQVTVQPVKDAIKQGPAWWEVLQQIWRERDARGAKPRSKEEVDADVQVLRDELEEHANAVERLQEDSRKAREHPPC
jgi:hypothetical protein